jgi:CHAT domain-containing protein
MRTPDHATLEQAFLYAGASTVIATRWRVEDASASALADRFYVHLTRHDPAEAMALAQRDLMRGSRFRDVSNWAGYTVNGSGSFGARVVAGPSRSGGFVDRAR